MQFVNAVLEQVRTNGDWKASYERWLVPTLTKAGDPIPDPPVAAYGRPQQ